MNHDLEEMWMAEHQGIQEIEPCKLTNGESGFVMMYLKPSSLIQFVE